LLAAPSLGPALPGWAEDAGKSAHAGVTSGFGARLRTDASALIPPSASAANLTFAIRTAPLYMDELKSIEVSGIADASAAGVFATAYRVKK
jgi:hypothetical protein